MVERYSRTGRVQGVETEGVLVEVNMGHQGSRARTFLQGVAFWWRAEGGEGEVPVPSVSSLDKGGRPTALPNRV